MLDLLSDVTRSARRLATAFDPGLLNASSLERVVDDVSAVIGRLETVRAQAAARLADTENWKKQGFRSAADALARQSRTSISKAKDSIDTGRRLSEQPEVSDAALRGDISFDQACLIADAVESDPKSALRLIKKAQRTQLAELKDEVTRTKAASCADLEARRRKIHEHRSLHDWTDTGGTWHLRAQGNPEDGAQFMAAIGQISDGLFQGSRENGREGSKQARDFDAAIELAKCFTSEERGTLAKRNPVQGTTEKQKGSRTGAPVKLLLRVDYDAFLRGMARSGETCELAGYGPISVGAVRDILKVGDPFVAAILTKGRSLIGVAHLGRRPTSHQKSALE